MAEHLLFASREEFRDWLLGHGQSSDGVWLLFGKLGGPSTVKPDEALEEALCFGWIDGQMQRVDDKTYIKYFAPRRKNSKWSDKNKAAAQRLERQGLMTDCGRAAIEEAKQNGQWDAPAPQAVTDDQVAVVSDLLKAYEPAHANFQTMSPSVRRTYARAYFDAKTDAGRLKRLSWMVERIGKNLKPM